MEGGTGRGVVWVERIRIVERTYAGDDVGDGLKSEEHCLLTTLTGTSSGNPA